MNGTCLFGINGEVINMDCYAEAATIFTEALIWNLECFHLQIYSILIIMIIYFFVYFPACDKDHDKACDLPFCHTSTHSVECPFPPMCLCYAKKALLVLVC